MKRLSVAGFFLRCTLSIFLAVTLTPGLAFAANGKITGRVVDRETREGLPGVNVIVTHTIVEEGKEVPLDRPLGGTTDPDGYYFILNAPPGVYVLTARIVGYTPITQKPVKVDLDRTITVNFQLSSTSIALDQVVVEARREIIKQDVSATQEVIVTSRIEQMPVLRVSEFIGRIKGVELVSGADGNGFSVRGGAIRETDVRMDGISLQDARSENSYLALNSTVIQEIQVLTGGFEAKYGGIRSGLLNVVTKEGQRDRYNVSLKADVSPAGQKRFFGTNPWSDDSWVYKVYTGKYAMNGIRTTEDSMAVPSEFWTFKGFKTGIVGNLNYNVLDTLQRLELWKRQHPQYSFADRPDYFFEGSITGPFPGAGLPLIGGFAEATTFMLGFKYEDSQLAFPLGPRDNYVDWNTQLKLTSQIADDMRFSVNGMYARVKSVSGGQTATNGGALVDASSSFGFLNTTPSSVQAQARLLAGTDGYQQMFNKSRLQFFDQNYFVGGAKLTHSFSPKAYYTLDFQVGYTSQNLSPFALDTSRADAWIQFYSTRLGQNVRFLNVPGGGSPNGSTNPGYDVRGDFKLYGGLQRLDSSHTTVFQFKGDLVTQLGRHHQVEAGFSSRLQNLFIYAGTWLQAQTSYTPDLWQYYRATPLDLGLYAQDKLEFEGMILNAGLRFDYFNPMKKGFVTGFPESDSYKDLYNKIYLTLPGAWGSYDRWVLFRDMLENPPGWPRTENRVQTYLSPRMGVSFPVTESSKLYFNYGHFYQRPSTTFLYDQSINIGSVIVPTPDLDMARTVSYEFGYEQMILSDFLFNVTAYYKDNRNEPLSRTYVDYYGDNNVVRYYPDAYSDIRGIELRVERPVGKFFIFNAMYEYSLYSGGQTGLAYLYENRLEARTAVETRPADLYNSDPRPRANINLNIHTPSDFGPEILGVQWFNKIYFNFLFDWRSGGRYLWNPEVTEVKDRIYVDAVNYWNIDFRGSKTFDLPIGSLELVFTVKNLTNNKFLVVANMTRSQLDDYKASLRLPFKGEGGSDKWGQWKSDDNHIKVGWWDAPLFLNPRQIILGMRLNL